MSGMNWSLKLEGCCPTTSLVAEQHHLALGDQALPASYGVALDYPNVLLKRLRHCENAQHVRHVCHPAGSL